MEEYFKVVLEDNEEILKIYKPNKLRTWFTSIVIGVALLFIFIPIIIVGFIDGFGLECLVAILLISIFVVGISVPFIALWYKKTIYAVTNKRILIRTGLIGVDYKSLDFTMLGAMTVNVSWADKLLKKNTGMISFGSMASPMMNSVGTAFTFSYLNNPYETYKEIKKIINEFNENKK